MFEEVLGTFNMARTIIKNARKFDDETGGMLVGTLGNPITIVAAGEAGENAVHLAAQFTSDPKADKKCLENARKIYGDSIEPVGYYHKHPAGFNTPSPGDRQQVLELKEQYNDNRPILMGIVNEIPGLVGKKVTLHLYGIDSKGNVVEYGWKLVNSRNKALLDAIASAPARPGTSSVDYWKDRDFQSYLNPIGRQRILLEIENLKKAGWQVRTSCKKLGQTLILDVFNGSVSLCFHLPPEFPLNPPTVFTNDGRRFIDMKALTQWSSQCDLNSLAEEAVCIMNCSRCRRQFIL